MNKLTNKIINEINTDLENYKIDFLRAEQSGLRIYLSKSLKRFFKEYNIKEQTDFNENFFELRDDFNLQDLPIEFCPRNTLLFNSYGLTDAPLIAIYGYFDNEFLPPPKYVFAYFANYQMKDFIQELLKDGFVTFETFLNETKKYNRFYKMEKGA